MSDRTHYIAFRIKLSVNVHLPGMTRTLREESENHLSRAVEWDEDFRARYKKYARPAAAPARLRKL
jgi:hypothetical protein